MFKKLVKFIKDVRLELKFVSWPTKDDVKEGTIVVIVMSAIVSVFLFIVDYAWSLIMNFLLKV